MKNFFSIRSDPVCELVFALIEKLFEVPYGVTHSVCELAFALSETKKTSSGFQPGIWFDRKTVEAPYGVTHSVCELVLALSETKKTSFGF